MFLDFNIEDYMLPCLNKKLFGMECMGCGFQRSVALLLHGEFVAAFKMYPAIYPLLALLVYVVLNLKFKFKNPQKIIRILAITSIVLIVANFFLKMI